jgi:hypothetical protein
VHGGAGPLLQAVVSRRFPFNTGCLPLRHSGNPGVNGVSYRVSTENACGRRFDQSIVQKSNPNVIYTFDYFEPDAYCLPPTPPKLSTVPNYPGNYSCVDLIGPWAWGGFPTNTSKPACADSPVSPQATTRFDAAWHAANFARWAVRCFPSSAAVSVRSFIPAYI